LGVKKSCRSISFSWLKDMRESEEEEVLHDAMAPVREQGIVNVRERALSTTLIGSNHKSQQKLIDYSNAKTG
jgi:hypothetical protein